jgi:hypothetical protein
MALNLQRRLAHEQGAPTPAGIVRALGSQGKADRNDAPLFPQCAMPTPFPVSRAARARQCNIQDFEPIQMLQQTGQRQARVRQGKFKASAR